MNNIRFISIAIVSALLAACGGDDSGSGNTGNSGESSSKARLAPTTCRTPDNGINYVCPDMTGFNGDQAASVSTSGNARVASIEFAQLNLKKPDSEYFIAVANREALLRVLVLADPGQTQLKAPDVILTITNTDSGEVVERQILKPAHPQMVLPTSGEASDVRNGNATIPDLYRSYLYRLPAQKVPAARLSVKAEIDAHGSGLSDTIFADNTATVHVQAVAVAPLKLVTVPILVGGTTPTLPSPELLKRAVMRYLPVSEVQVRVRAEPYQVPDSVLGGATPLTYVDGPLVALLRINWDLEGKFPLLPGQDGSVDETYIGFALGMLGGSADKKYKTVVMGDYMPADGERSLSTPVHEILHLAGFHHQPVCGARFGADDRYPYPGGTLGGVWGVELTWDAAKIVMKSPGKHTSMMGYCYSRYVSDFHVAAWVAKHAL